MAPSFVDLTYFYETACSLNFSRAAAKLGVSQPTLSYAIGRLETKLNTSLFIRHSQGVTLTLPGQRLQIHVAELIQQWKKTEHSIQSLNQEISGQVSIGGQTTLIRPIASLVASLLQKHNRLEIKIINESSDILTNRIIEGVIDIGIVVDPIPHPDLVMVEIDEVELTFWVSSQVKTDESIIIYDMERKQLRELLKKYEKINPSIRYCSSNNHQLTAELTANGAGIGILAACYVELEYKLKLKRLTNAPVHFGKMYLIYRGENRKMLARETVLTAIKELIEFY